MKTKTVTASFPIGAWVRDQQMRRLSGDIEKNPITGAVRFAPSGGEIIGTGELCKSPVYRVKFAESFGFVSSGSNAQSTRGHMPATNTASQRMRPKITSCSTIANPLSTPTHGPGSQSRGFRFARFFHFRILAYSRMHSGQSKAWPTCVRAWSSRKVIAVVSRCAA